MSYANDLLALVATFRAGANALKIYETPDEVKLVVRAIDCGLCRLVKNNFHTVRLFDRGWNITLGIELTPEGHKVLEYRAAA